MKKMLLLAAVTLTAGIVSAQTLKLKKGQEYNYTTSLSGTVTQSMAGQQMVMNMSTGGYQTFTVEDKKGDNYVILGKVVLDSLVLKSSMMDSTFRPGEAAAEIIRYEVANLGKVISKADARPEGSNSGAAFQMGFDMKQALPLIPFENAKVKSGDTWTVDESDSINFMGGLLVVTTKSNYTIVGETKHNGVKCLQVKKTADIANEGNTSMQGMDFYIDGTGKTAGDLFIDAKTGMLLEEDLVTENEINMALSGQQSMVIPISQKMTSHRALKK